MVVLMRHVSHPRIYGDVPNLGMSPGRDFLVIHLQQGCFRSGDVDGDLGGTNVRKTGPLTPLAGPAGGGAFMGSLKTPHPITQNPWLYISGTILSPCRRTLGSMPGDLKQGDSTSLCGEHIKFN